MSEDSAGSLGRADPPQEPDAGALGELDLAAGVLHDLRNSMGYISSNLAPLRQYIADLTELLEVYEEMEKGLGTQERDYLSRFKGAIELPELLGDLKSVVEAMSLGGVRSASLIDEMRMLLLPTAPKIVRCPANPRDAAADSVRIFAERFSPEVRFSLEGDEVVPDVNCPQTGFVRILDNLIVNAIYATRGQPDALVAIRITADQGAGLVSVVVADNGVGIPEAARARLFDPYYTTRSPTEGTGLGLAIVRKLVVDSGGDLRFDSVEGEGTEFEFTLSQLGD